MKPIFINSSPNTTFDDILRSFRELFSPWNWSSDNNSKFEKEVETYLSTNAVAFDSARASFYMLLRAWGVGEGDEVIVPAFTCTVIVNPILWVGAKPVYVDIDKETLNTNLDRIKEKTSKKTRVILAQHTFGKPLKDIEEIVQFSKENNIKVVEDCAHSLGLKYKDKYLGTFGDASVITFGITKVISGGRGGMAIVQSEELKHKLIELRSALPNFPRGKAIKFILNSIIWYFVTPIYYLGIGKLTIGKVIVFILQKLKIISITNIVEQCEELGMRPIWLPTKMSKSLGNLAKYQFSKLEKLNNHRSLLANVYADELGELFDNNHLYIRYPYYVENKEQVLSYFRTKRIILGDWYKAILHIPESNYGRLYYTKGECPNSEFAAKHLVNLPTFIKVDENQVRYISKEIQKFKYNESD